MFYLSEWLGGIATPKSAVFLSPLTDSQTTFRYLAFFLETLRPGFSLWLQDRLCVRRSQLVFCLGDWLILGVNYHLGREDLRISASRVGDHPPPRPIISMAWTLVLILIF